MTSTYIPTGYKVAAAVVLYFIIAIWTCLVFYKRDSSWTDAYQQHHPEIRSTHDHSDSAFYCIVPGLLWPIYWTERVCDATTDWARFNDKDVP